MDIRMGGKDFSLDEEIKAGERQTKIEFLESGNQNQEDIVLKQEEAEALNSALAEALEILNDREKYIIEKRILTEDQLTLEDIGNKFKISRERVRQIEKTAIGKIKKILLKLGVKAHF